MRRFWPGTLRATFAVMTLALLAGCERETTPPLIEVRGVSPRELEEGDRLTIEGVGFPEGKVAHVAFRGDLHRPGVPVVTNVLIEVDAVVVSSSEVDIPFNAAIERLFAGPGDHAAHTTFRGDVTVAFAAKTPAAPPVAGTLHDGWLDVRPPTPHRPALLAESAEGERTLAFLGIKHEGALLSGGVLIESIEPGSRADMARLLPNDVITEVDGVRVLSLRDLVAVPGARDAWLKIRRGGSPNEEIARVSLLGFKPPPAAALLGPMLTVGLAAILLLLFAPTPAIVAWLARAISTRLVPRLARPRGSLLRRLMARGIRAFGSLGATAFALAFSSALFALLPFSHALGLGEVDAGILFVVSTTALLTLAMVTGGAHDCRAGTTVGRGLRAVALTFSLAVPSAMSLIGAVTLIGSLRVDDLVHAQGGSPWRWTVFTNPCALALFFLSFLAIHASSASTASALPDADGLLARPSPRVVDVRARVFARAQTVHTLVLAALGAALFLGGWQIPGLAAEQVEAHIGWMFVGALLYIGKTWFVAGAILGAKSLLPPIRANRAMSLAWRWLVPLSSLFLLLLVLLAPLTEAWASWRAGPSAETLVGAVMLVLTCAGALHVFARVRYFLGSPPPELDPFL